MTDLTDLADLADLTEEQRRLLALRLRKRTDEPLSFTQEQLWFLDRLEPGNPAYDIPFGLRLSGPLDRDALEIAVAAVVARHPALRTTFVERDGELRQRSHDRVTVPVEVTDVSAEADPEAAARAVATGHARFAFDLTSGPLIAVRLVVLAPEDHLLLVTAHHIVFDATSAALFSRDLVACYDGQELPPVGSFARHAAAERRRLTGDVLDRSLAHWREKLRGSPVTSTFPPDHPRPAVQTHRGGRLPFTVPAGLTAALAERARRHGVTLNAVVLSGFAALLRRATGQGTVLLGMPVAGRSRTGLESVIGSFANMLVLRVDVADEPVADLVKRTHRTISEAHSHQDAPYARVVEAVDPPRDPGHNPLFQAMLSLTDAPAGPSTARGVAFTPVEADSGLTDFDLFVALSRVDGELRGEIGYNADLYLPETVERVAADFTAVLEVLAHHESLAELGRGRVAVASSFTGGPLREPLELLTGVLRLPVEVEQAPYHQVVQHLLAGGGGGVADVVLLRWEDWLRHGEGDGALDAVLRDLGTAITTYRQLCATPLLLVVCPPTPGAGARVAEFDDRLALLVADLPDVEALWWTDHADRYPVTALHDPQSDRLGHIPYTPEFFAALALLLAGELHRLGGLADAEPHLAAVGLSTPAAVAERATPSRAAISLDTPAVAPRTTTEQRLARLWQEELGLDQVGVTHSFFALGGHSLLATRLLSRVHAEFGADVPLHALFTAPTVEALARVVESAGADQAQAIHPAPRDGDLLPSSTQQRLWAIGQLGGDPARHNTTFAAVLTGDLDVEALRRAVEGVVRRHEVLRTTFAERDGKPVMVVHDAIDCWVGEEDLTDESPRDRAIAVRQHLRSHTKHRYDLAAGPLLRIRLVRTGEAEHHLLLGMHHIICDNSSWGVLLSELADRYAGQAEPPALPVQFADFAAWQHDLLSGDELRPHVAYWRERLRGAPALTSIATDKPRPRERTDRAGRSRTRIAGGAAIHELARTTGVTPFTVLLAAYALLLHERGAQPDVVVGVPQAGRNRPELEPLIGCFTDLLPVRVDLAGAPTFRQVAQRVHRTVIESYEHQDVPFAAIVEALGHRRTAAHHPVFQCAFNLADLPDGALTWADLDVRPLDVPATGIDFDLFLNLSWDGDGLDAVLEHSADLFTPDGGDDLLTDFAARLGELVAAPDEPIATARAAVERTALRVASSSDVADTRPVLEWWADRLGLAVEARFLPPGQLLRPLLDRNARLGEDAAALVLRWEDLLPADPAPGAVARFEVRFAALREALDRFAGDLTVVVTPGGRVTAQPWPRVFAQATDRLRAALGDGKRVLETDDVGTALARVLHRHVARPVDTVTVDAGTFPGDVALFARAQTRFGREVVVTGEVEPAVLELSGATAGRPAGFVVDVPDAGALAHLWPLDEPGPGGDLVLPADLLAGIAGPLRTAEGVRRAMSGGPVAKAGDAPKVPPRTDRERALAAVWSQVLRVPGIGVHDDFFELGGDSMTAIEAVALANRTGWSMTPRQLVATPTIAGVCAADPVAVDAEQGLVDGEFPPTGAQRWFFDVLAPSMTAPAHFNHPYYLALRADVPVEHLERAVAALAAHHDGLRLRFRAADDGWTASHAPVGDAVPFESHRVAGVAEADAVVDRLQASLDLDGPLARVVHLALPDEPDRVLVIAHHLVTDGVSRNLLLEDLQTALRQLAEGREPALPAKTTAYRDWARRLDDHRRSAALAAELPFWLAQAPGAEQVPVDLPGHSTFGTLDTAGLVLDAATTDALRDHARTRGVGVSDLLVWSALRLVADWTGVPEWTVATTGHGREALFDDVDLSRTLGWFQVLYPVRLRDGDVTDVARQLRGVPRGGIGHGLLRSGHPDPEVRRALSAAPQLAVNYMGAFGFEDVSSADELFDLCRGELGRVQDPGGRWPSRLDVVGTLVGDRLRVDLNYGALVHRRDTVERLLDRLQGLLQALATKEG